MGDMTDMLVVSDDVSDALAARIAPVVRAFVGSSVCVATITSTLRSVLRTAGYVAEVRVLDPEDVVLPGHIVPSAPSIKIKLTGRCPGTLPHAPRWEGL